MEIPTASPPTSDNILVRFNRIYFLGEVSTSKIASLIGFLHGLLSGPYTSAELVINSDGGDASPALAFVDFVNTFPIPVTGIATGVCASAGTLMVSACFRRWITPSALWMVHQPSGIAWGNTDAVEDEAKALKLLTDQAVEIYARRNTKLKPAAIRDLLKRNTWMTAKEALKQGFVDAIA